MPKVIDVTFKFTVDADQHPEVVETLLAVAQEMVELPFVAVTLVEREEGKVAHRVARCSLPQAEGGAGRIEGLVFGDNVGLASQAVKLDATLPGRDLRLDATVIFDEHTRLRGLSSLKVLPIRAGKRVLGTLVVGRRRGAIGAEELRQLEVVALQAGASLERAELFDRTERMATTDGLTGLVNHRTFQERFEARLAEATRYGRKLSLLLTDIDHFKLVNDTWSHQVGDHVLSRLGAELRSAVRDLDLAARYGGEEFTVILPETCHDIAMALAEEIRHAVELLGIPHRSSPTAPRLTVSLGVVTVLGDGYCTSRRKGP